MDERYVTRVVRYGSAGCVCYLREDAVAEIEQQQKPVRMRALAYVRAADFVENRRTGRVLKDRWGRGVPPKTIEGQEQHA